jgi:hypothetical protein
MRQSLFYRAHWTGSGRLGGSDEITLLLKRFSAILAQVFGTP